MEAPKPIYRIAINHKAREYKTFETEEQATSFARAWIEADGNHIFLEAKRGCDGLLVLRWMEWVNEKPCIISKIIGIANTKELKAYEEYVKAERWQKTVERIIKNADKVKKIPIKKQQTTEIICWID